MEVAASCFAVASIAIQLIESISKITAFFNSVKEAPDEIASLIEDLALLRGVLEDTRQRDEQTRRGSSSTMDLALARCTRLMNELARLVPPDQKSTSTFRRKRANFKFLRKGDKIRQLKAKIEGTKLDLLLAHCHLESRINQNHQDFVHQSFSIMETRQLDTIREIRVLSHQEPGRQQHMLLGDATQASLLSDQMTEIASSSAHVGSVELTASISLDVSQTQPLKSPIRVSSATGSYRKAKRYSSSFKRTYTTVTQTPFGKLVCMTTRHGTCCNTWVYHDCDAEVETTYTFVPFWWVVKFGMTAFQLDISQISTQGWQTKIRAWNMRPENSPIFKACERGDVGEVRRMLAENEASINDTDESGWTLLHFAAYSLQTQVCRLLLDEGVDKYARCLTLYKSSPVDRAYCPGQFFHKINSSYDSNRKFMASYQETIQLFLTSTEDGCELSGSALNYYTTKAGLWISDTGEENLRWFLNSVFQVACPTTVSEQLWSNLLHNLLIQYSYDNQPTGMEVFVSETLRRCSLESALSVLWRLFDPQDLYFARMTHPWRRPAFTRRRIFQLLVEKTGGIKSLYTPRSYRERQQSLLSHVMESSSQWRLFVYTLNQSSFEVLEVIRGDLELYQCGWTEEGLAAMFDPKDIDWLNSEERAVIYDCKQHDWLEFMKWDNCAMHNIDQRWEMKKNRCVEGVALDTPSCEEMVLLASWKELSNTQNPTSCFVCNWVARQSPPSARDSEGEVGEDSTGMEDSPFLLTI